jgi:hypothetical protein
MIEQLGTSPLFLGVETGNWTLADFETAARNAHALGCTSLLVKIADGGNLWHSGIGGWQKVLDTVSSTGVRGIPYMYNYGDKFNAIQTEIGILTAAMQHSGIAIADMEVEMNDETKWGTVYADALKPIKGIFGVTTWADPELQNWHGVLAALAPAVNFWLPQVYSDYLASVYHAQFDPYGLPYYPVLNLGTDAGANNIVQIAKESNSPVVGFWEYEPAIGAYAVTVKEIVAMSKAKLPAAQPAQPEPAPKPATPVQTGETAMNIKDPFAAQYFQEVNPGEWYCPTTKQRIIGDVLKFYLKVYGAPRLPLSPEQTDVVAGKNFKWQHCEAGVIIFDPDHVHDRPTNDACYLEKLDSPIVRALLQSQQLVAVSQVNGTAATALTAMLANIRLLEQSTQTTINEAEAQLHGIDALAVTVQNVIDALPAK